MKHLRLTVIKNATSNLIRGGATGAVAILLPRFLTRVLVPERFAAWSLILQIAAYASFLDFGLSTAVARFVAHAMELEQKERQARLVSTALAFLTVAALIGFVVISVVIWQIPHVFHGVSQALLPEFRRAALLLSISACLLLPFSAYTSVLIGMHRNEITAFAGGVSRLIGAAAVIGATHYTQSLVVLTICIAVPNILAGLLQMTAVHRLLAESRFRISHISRAIGRELLRSCASLTISTFGMLLVSGLDLTVVGHFNFAAVGYYSVAAILISFFSGLTGAAFSALMAPVAALHARLEMDRIRQIVFSATRMTMLVNFFLTTVIFFWGGALLRLWVGPVYAASALPILKILAIAQTIRLTAAPYSVMLVSTNEQSKGVSAAIFEALLNLAASILGAMYFGPVGVAWGTLIGAIGGLLWTFALVMPAAQDVPLHRVAFLKDAVLPGIIPYIPFLVLWLAIDHLQPVTYSVVLTLCVIATSLLIARSARFSLRRVAS
jgi:O-antigen/teichoic acid export membrane protein